jgi:hypothetical protein
MSHTSSSGWFVGSIESLALLPCPLENLLLLYSVNLFDVALLDHRTYGLLAHYDGQFFIPRLNLHLVALFLPI